MNKEPPPKPNCYLCKHRGLTLTNIYCRALERVIDPSKVKDCYLYQPTRNKPSNDLSSEDCRACNRCKRPQDVNEVVLSLAGIKQSDEGPGTTLHKIITWFIPKPEGCDCANRVLVMNSFGYQRCLQELPTILSWLRESALDNNIPYSEYVIATVVKNILKHGLKK